MAQEKRHAVAERDDLLACMAITLLQEAGAVTSIVSELPEISTNGNIVFTSKNRPERFPNAHLRLLGHTVFIKQHPVKHSGFPVAVIDMGRRLNLVSTPPREKRKRNRGRHSDPRHSSYMFF